MKHHYIFSECVVLRYEPASQKISADGKEYSL